MSKWKSKKKIILLKCRTSEDHASVDEEKEEENASKNSKSMENAASQSKQPKSVHNASENASKSERDNNSSNKKTEAKDHSKEISNTDENPNVKPVFDTPKEKQCWDMYCKMSEKGVNISFDTILRGMLTPTEYRLRSKSITNAEGNAENNTENNADTTTDS